ncbi:prolyl oligopeptidase family serine peptidase [Wenzhouxiangella sp. XN201]|uniref:alpha/beta fold hydrolase n=1 Tax=Wenzhouxiangella sp. XN201 TaxID=2710755 RepID=UPI0013CB5B8A|nr:alpha/beta fold hydrolase [Wenzhouxiangella sp. XN201]NEZ03298.1 prolyl oligopeptidase family serine peptidase [Wenzhouxiangella sp. XN201]
MQARLITLFLLGLTIASQAQTPPLKQIMADPDWIGPPVEQAWWQLDGSAVNYRVERPDSDLDDIHQIDLERGEDRRLDYAEQAVIDGPDPIVHHASGRVVFVRDGNLFARLPDRDRLLQLTRSTESDAQPAFSPDGKRVIFRRDSQWWVHDFERGLNWPATDLRFEDKPDAEPEDELGEMQLRLFQSLRDQQADKREARTEAEKAASQDPTRSVAPWYLGDDMEMQQSSLSPDGRWLLLAVSPKDHDDGDDGQMPHYVTNDGYIDVEDVRTRVGRNAPPPQTLWLLDLEKRSKHELAFDDLPGIGEDPLAELKQAQDIDPLADDENRPVSINDFEWHAGGELAAVQIRAIDNKDRWLAIVDTADDEPALHHRHRLSDVAWINWYFNDFGWLPDSETLWLLSEESGYSHFYTVDARAGAARQRTEGDFEVLEPVVRADGRTVLLLANRSHPAEYDLYQLDLELDELERVTEQRGIESFTLRPGDDERALVRYSSPYLPPQAGLVDLETGELEALTDTRTDAFKTIEWQQPEIVGVPSSHVDRPVWSKFYPARSEPPHGGDRHPVVLFVHGAGYLQNTWLRYPNYFREQMFHNLLTERGYHVLDMDYRASAGYGRDWRTAIYRQMGTPELEDLIDGVDWLVENHNADPGRVGVYGGSYGGFMAFMAMFRAPEVFQAGAALRPVTDWAHYNHFYTSNILNTPEVDPEAYRRSSPIEFAEGLDGHLLIAHGMLDDNVFYQDSVRLAQRLIELEKDHWEMASYPMERHGFTRPDSWRDEYWRILNLFENTIGGN